MSPRPAAVAPRRYKVVLIANIRHGIEPCSAEPVTATQTRCRQPEAAPCPVRVDGLQRVLRAGREVPAVPADERLQRPAIDMDGQFESRGEQTFYKPVPVFHRECFSPSPAAQAVQSSNVIPALVESWTPGTRPEMILFPHCAASTRSAPDRRASISSSARSTASKKSSVEAWRAL